MIKENEQMKQPTYEQLVLGYNNVVRELEQTKLELQAIKSDKILDRLSTMLMIIKTQEYYPKDLVKLAKWHAKQIMSKPKQ